jgi:Eco57I restriction-modification methylase/TaqI-like C-terminal specificity domain
LAVDEADLKSVDPLPNLDFKFVCANSLLSLASEHEGFEFGVDPKLDAKLADIRASYFETSSPTKKTKLKDAYYKLTHPTFASDVDLRTRQLNSFDPFKFSGHAQFFDPKQMFGIEGFDIVVANPPYIGEKGNKATFDQLKGSSLRERFYQGRADIFHYFIHLGIDVLDEDGILVFITTNYYPTATLGSTLREDIAERTKVLELVNFNELKVFESALGQHNLITVLQKSDKNDDYFCHQIVATATGAIDQKQLNEILASNSTLAHSGDIHVHELFDGSEKYIRFLSGTGVDAVLEKVAGSGSRLDALAEVNQGVIPGVDRFTPRWQKKHPEIKAPVGSPIFVLRHGEHNFPHLQPWFKGSDIARFVAAESPNWDVLYFGDSAKPSEEEMAYLSRFKTLLAGRDEFKDGRRDWWELHRARRREIFLGQKVIAPYRSYNNRFAFNDRSFFAGADITFITSRAKGEIDLFFLLGLLNSELIYAWFYYRGKRKGDMLELKAVPVSEVPIPRNNAIESGIAALATKACDQLKKDPSSSTAALEAEIDKMVYVLYDLTPKEIEAVHFFAESQAAIRKMAPAADAGDE